MKSQGRLLALGMAPAPEKSSPSCQIHHMWCGCCAKTKPKNVRRQSCNAFCGVAETVCRYFEKLLIDQCAGRDRGAALDHRDLPRPHVSCAAWRLVEGTITSSHSREAGSPSPRRIVMLLNSPFRARSAKREEHGSLSLGHR